MLPSDGLPRLGAYFGEALPAEPEIWAFERRTGTACAIVSYYWSWGLGRSRVPIDFARGLLAAGRCPLLTWEPWRLPVAGRHPADDPEFGLAQILAGEHDAYIDWFADHVARLPGRILLRPMHEMNGDWYPWCGTTNGNRPDEFVAAWRHLRRRFARRYAVNVDWVWSPYAISVPAVDDNAIARYFPGEEHVDVVALDGYNWGDSRPWARWQTFDEVFAAAYRVVTSLSARPVVVAEVGCAATGGDKRRWLADAWRRVAQDYASIRAVVWFNVEKECDWRVDAPTEIQASFRSTWGSADEFKAAAAPVSVRS